MEERQTQKQNKNQKMSNKLTQVVAIIIIISLTMFQILYTTSGIVIAAYEQTGQQNNKTNQTNVKFDTYLKNEEESKDIDESQNKNQDKNTKNYETKANIKEGTRNNILYRNKNRLTS